MADSFQLKAIITAVDQLTGPMKGMQRQLKGFQKEFSSLAVGATAIGASILGALAIPVNQAIKFESTMADIRKVVDGLDNADAFRKMSQDVIDLSTKLPITADGIGQIVAAAGQAGIARSELVRFAEDAAKMGIAFDQTAEESGQMMATWRTAFKMTQKDVVGLADKVNYLGNTGPASAAKISEIVTSVGSLAAVNHVSTGNLAALGATIAGMGVQSEVASTGIQNFMLSLSNANTGNAKKVLKKIGMTPKSLASGMVKDSKATMLKVLEGIKNLPEESKSKALEWLFGRESIKAIAPLLNNLDLLRKNFGKVADAQQYAGSMQKEYDSRADTTENKLTLMQNGITAVSLALGDALTPQLKQAVVELMPYLKQTEKFVRDNPELVRSVAKFAISLIAVGAAVGTVSQAFKVLNFVMNLSPAKLAIAALAAGALLIINNWDQVGPIVKQVWTEIDNVAQEMGGWQTVIEGIGAVMAGSFALKTIGSLQQAVTLASSLSSLLGSISRFGAMTITIGIAISLLKQLQDLDKQANAQGVSKGEFLVNRMQSQERERGYNGFFPRLREILGMDNPIPEGRYDPKVGLERASSAGRPQAGELKVNFENAPPGMRVATPAGSATPWLSYDVGYNRFSANKS
ncbi:MULTISPECIES: phage tail tape measure protein [Pantoea]|jgi:TP901 family phage tail tape measure protein|uniref:Phage tail tape measure protein n=2 Tax=root TaxID=1 RepID=A0A7Y6NBC8_9GAMM|nr:MULTISPECIES: phage tail tape measure protein [Pantoea]DAE10041.1 MAG TPA: minor tail protein [Siphoviridae sp. ct4sp3]MBZ6393747.1 phage tail tape measure protein [Pantoea sp.]MBZ6437270.1 phage tail tape measure protein [Pantoea sp.]NUY40476.1 phage tail tape measure protein [Pantoea brenneri]NUY47440.1 phage tail tape measure protein [Pantoea brenneri]